MNSYLDSVRRHALLIDRQGHLPQNAEDLEDLNWQIEQAERLAHRARVAFIAHRKRRHNRLEWK